MGHIAPTIYHLLREEGMRTRSVGIHTFLQKYRETKSIVQRPGSGRPTKMTTEVKVLVEQKMKEDDETTAIQLHTILVQSGYTMTLQMVLRCHSALGWTFRGSVYCQVIWQENKGKRLEWAQQHKNNSLADIIWTDKCLVQMESHHRFCCCKCREVPKGKPSYAILRSTVYIRASNSFIFLYSKLVYIVYNIYSRL